MLYFFFCKQRTEYEMRISDWSSDVCSADLYLVNDVSTGPLVHKLLVGYDYIQNVSPVGGSNYNARGYRNAANNGAINTYDPASRDSYLIRDNRPVPNVSHFDLANPDYSISEISGYFNVSSPQAVTKYFVNGIYVQDDRKSTRLNS